MHKGINWHEHSQGAYLQTQISKNIWEALRNSNGFSCFQNSRLKPSIKQEIGALCHFYSPLKIENEISPSEIFSKKYLNLLAIFAPQIWYSRSRNTIFDLNSPWILTLLPCVIIYAFLLNFQVRMYAS